MKNIHSSKNSNLKIANKENITIHQIFWYLVIFSILGLLIETLYCYTTTGILESRKGLLWGPFCPVYGVGATILIVILSSYRNKPIRLFLYGSILGGFIEYFLSFLLEAIYGTRFWDYSYLQFHLNGRICITYSIFWGLLSFFLIKGVQPFIDHFLDKIPTKLKGSIEFFLSLFLLFDIVFTIWGVSIYKKRAMELYYHLPSQETSFFSELKKGIFSDENMMKTFPNLRFVDEKGEEVFIRTIFESNIH